MVLRFLGIGGSDNQIQGNTSAFFIENKNMFLIDCGENIFERICKKGLLNEVDKVNIFITHTHSDHVGSLGSLIFHCYFKLKIEVNLVIPNDALHLNDIITLLKIYGVDENWYKIISPNELDNKFTSFNTVRYQETKHVLYIPSYGLLFDTSTGFVYYSGDTNELNNIKMLLSSNKPIDKIYMDVTTTKSDIKDKKTYVHFNIDRLNEEIDSSIKDKFYCMHFNKPECIDIAKKYGFNVAEIE